MLFLITNKETNNRVILPIDSVSSIVELENNNAFVTLFGLSDCGESLGIETKEKFDDIMSILSKNIIVK